MPNPERIPLTSSRRASRCRSSVLCHAEVRIAAIGASPSPAFVERRRQQCGIVHSRPCLSGEGRADQRGPQAGEQILVGGPLDALNTSPEGVLMAIGELGQAPDRLRGTRHLAGLCPEESLEEDGIGGVAARI